MNFRPDEFYVGYIGQAPRQTGRVVRRLTIVLGILIVAIASTLAWNQKPFSFSQFEYGVSTSLEGNLFMTPVPHLVLPLGSDKAALFQNVLLVGVGKAGAQEVIAHLEQKTGKSLAGRRVTLIGSLIYGEGRALLQIAEEDNLSITPSDIPTVTAQPWGTVSPESIHGEIVDPKCYFGVMKPAEGKPHRACAIRCIAGGIPPILHTDKGEYYVLVNEDGGSINEEILSLVGDEILLSGETISWNDWKLFKVSTRLLREMSNQKIWKEKVTAFEKGIAQCSEY